MIFADFADTSFESVSHNNRIRKHVLLRKGQCANLIQLARSVFPQGESVKSHCHQDMMEVFMVRSGTGLIIIDRKSYDLKRDVCAIVEPGEFHKLINTGQDTLTIDYFALKVE
jgi:mannose-6-phosphate isomerase-like protein (cupin superfamily)